MPTYEVTDPQSGQMLSLEGDSPPTEQELEQVFAAVPKQQPAKAPVETPGMVKGIANEALQGATFGFSDEIQSVIAAAVASPFVSDKTFSQLMVDARASLRDESGAFRKENPKTAFAANVAGGFATGGAGAVKSLGTQLVKEGLKSAAVESAKQGAKFGAVAGAGFSDQPEFLSAETAKDTATGAAVGATVGAAIPTAIAAIKKVGAIVPKELPRSLFQSSVKFRPSLGTDEKAKMTETALEEGILPTVKGLEKITTKLETLDKRLNTFIDEATKRGTLISKNVLFGQLKQLRKELGGAQIDAADDLDIIGKVAKSFNQQLDSINKDKLTPRELLKLKRNAYKRIDFDMGQLQSNFAKNETKGAIARGARIELEKISPEIKPLNERMGRLIGLREELDRAASRLENRNLISLDTAAKVGAGAATGSTAGAATGVAASVLGNPKIKARLALLLENIRRASETAASASSRLPPELSAALGVVIGRMQDDLKAGLDEDLADE